MHSLGFLLGTSRSDQFPERDHQDSHHNGTDGTALFNHVGNGRVDAHVESRRGGQRCRGAERLGGRDDRKGRSHGDHGPNGKDQSEELVHGGSLSILTKVAEEMQIDWPAVTRLT